MKKLMTLTMMLLLVSACTTPKTVLKNEDTGQVMTCGGNTTSSLFGGVVGYYVQKSSDSDCKADFLEQGFVVVKSDEADKQEKH